MRHLLVLHHLGGHGRSHVTSWAGEQTDASVAPACRLIKQKQAPAAEPAVGPSALQKMSSRPGTAGVRCFCPALRAFDTRMRRRPLLGHVHRPKRLSREGHDMPHTVSGPKHCVSGSHPPRREEPTRCRGILGRGVHPGAPAGRHVTHCSGRRRSVEGREPLMRVLIAETDALLAHARREQLLIDGHDSLLAASAHAAQLQLGELPDAVLLGDLAAPVVTIAFLRALRLGAIQCADSRVPVVVIGADSDRDRIRYYHAGADALLPSDSSPLLVAAALEAAHRRAAAPAPRLVNIAGVAIDLDARR